MPVVELDACFRGRTTNDQRRDAVVQEIEPTLSTSVCGFEDVAELEAFAATDFGLVTTVLERRLFVFAEGLIGGVDDLMAAVFTTAFAASPARGLTLPVPEIAGTVVAVLDTFGLLRAEATGGRVGDSFMCGAAGVAT